MRFKVVSQHRSRWSRSSPSRRSPGAGKIGNGSSVGSAQVFVPNPVSEPRRRVAHRPEGFGRGRPACGLPRRPADEPRRQRLPARRLRDRLQRDRQPGLLADQHVRLHAQPGRVRAGDGVLLDHRGAEVHPEPRLRHDAPRDRQPAAAGPHQPARRGQLVRDRPPDARAPLRQGRRRRRRGRGGDPARVRARDPLVAELQLRLRAGGRDQRGLRRLLGRDRLRRRLASASACRSWSRSRAWPTGTRPRTPAGRCTACGGSTRTCTTRPT